MYQVMPFRIQVLIFLCGLFNNFAYVVSLSAAKIIFSTEIVSSHTHRKAHTVVSQVLFYADGPAFIAQFCAPFLLKIITYNKRILILSILCTSSLLLIGFNEESTGFYSKYFSIVGIILTSIMFGFGESTFYSLWSSFPKKAIGCFAAGTGAAGIVGSGVFDILLRMFGMKTTLIILASFGIIFYILYMQVLSPYHQRLLFIIDDDLQNKTQNLDIEAVKADVEETKQLLPLQNEDREGKKTHRQHHCNEGDKNDATVIMRSFCTYFIPLYILYVVTFLSNHGFLPHLIRNEKSYLQNETNDYYYVNLFFTYQLSVFFARSSIKFVNKMLALNLPIQKLYIWIIIVFQILLTWAIYVDTSLYRGFISQSNVSSRMPIAHTPIADETTNIFSWAMFEQNVIEYKQYFLVFIQGILSGLGYLLCFHLARLDIENNNHKDFIMGIICTATTAGPLTSAIIGTYYFEKY